MLLHTIGKMGDAIKAPDPFTDKYVFPGYHLPSISQMQEASQRAKLIASDVEILRLHYALTLREWLKRFTAAREKMVKLYDERFFRMWEFYLSGGIVMFESGSGCNFQVQYVRDRNALPITRDYMVFLFAIFSRKLTLSRNLAFSAIVLAVSFVILPRTVFGSAYADMRLAPFLLAVGLLAIRFRGAPDRRTAHVLAVLGLLFFATRTAANTISLARAADDQSAKLAALDVM